MARRQQQPTLHTALHTDCSLQHLQLKTFEHAIKTFEHAMMSFGIYSTIDRNLPLQAIGGCLQL